ncbi:MAG TPA: BrnA antitoxin family protein [Pyrinomonadaceae bacterium]|nr:BrnA antitoxin family protein [Pyrinomonadaceae bacterium]
MKKKEIIVEISQKEYEEMKAEGYDEDEILKPGKHVFKRVPQGRLATEAALHPSNTKVQITIKIDLDILNHFKARAEKANAAPYQTQINSELRAVMERDLKDENSESDITVERLLENDEFLRRLSEKLKDQTPKAA